jgi:hypothetical protein
MEHPPLGQFLRQVAGLSSDQLGALLEQQYETGGRVGEIARERGWCSKEQLQESLRLQAQWVADSLRSDFGRQSLPYPAFLSLCLPAYNESKNIVTTLESATAMLPAFVRRHEIIVVNDGSQDETETAVRRFARKEPSVRLVNHSENRGYGAAVTSGLRAARGDLIAFTDADGQFSFLDLPRLLARLDGAEVVVGYRYCRADPWHRRLNAWGWNWLIRTVLGVWVRDLDCAFKLFRREIVDQLRLTATGAAINAEIMAQIVRRNVRLCELPVRHYPRYHGAPTGAALRVILRAFRELPRLWKYRFEPALAVEHVQAGQPQVVQRGVQSA